MNTNFSLLFYLKKRLTYVSGPIPIYLRITLDGQCSELSTGREILPEKWNSDSCRGTGTKDDIRQLNMNLDTMKQKYMKHIGDISFRRSFREEQENYGNTVIPPKTTKYSTTLRTLKHNYIRISFYTSSSYVVDFPFFIRNKN
jgi:hypothetical protein